MRLITVPLSMLLLLLTLGGCLAGGGHYGPSYGYGYGSYGYAPYGGHAHRHYHHSYRVWEPPQHHRQQHHHQHHRPLFPHRPIRKKW
jgi:hypothetical protein